MTSKKTTRDEIIEMKATLKVRDKFINEERNEVKKDIKQLTTDVSKIQSGMVGVNTEVFNLKETVDEVKTDVKAGFISLETKMDVHFNGNGKGRSKKKTGAFATIISTVLASLGGGLWQLGIRIGWWA